VLVFEFLAELDLVPDFEFDGVEAVALGADFVDLLGVGEGLGATEYEAATCVFEIAFEEFVDGFANVGGCVFFNFFALVDRVAIFGTAFGDEVDTLLVLPWVAVGADFNAGGGFGLGEAAAEIFEFVPLDFFEGKALGFGFCGWTFESTGDSLHFSFCPLLYRRWPFSDTHHGDCERPDFDCVVAFWFEEDAVVAAAQPEIRTRRLQLFDINQSDWLDSDQGSKESAAQFPALRHGVRSEFQGTR
jgi:hypothetical protein